MNDKYYIKRLFDGTLEFALKSKGAVLIVGPKWCGKSTTARRFAKSVIDLTDEETKEQYIAMAKNAVTKFLMEPTKPLLIDEWQEIAFIWNNIKKAVDESQSFGQFILTGSVTDNIAYEKKYERHTGTGRIIRKMMRPMSLFESNDSSGNVSINDLKNGKFNPAWSKKDIYDYAFLICRGGWPLAITDDKDVALQQAIDFYDGLVNDDLFSLKDIPIRKDVQRAKKFLKSYARCVASESPDAVIINDMTSNDETFNVRTFDKFFLALERLYVVEELEAWNPNLRSKIAIREKNTRHFVDPSIAAAALSVGPDGLFADMNTFGLLFESLAIRDLRIYCDVLGANVYHYRDKQDREADAVIQFKDGSFGLVEVKMGDRDDLDKAAEKLLSIAKDIDEEKTGKLAFLMIITKDKVANKREDGVYEIPLACLKD